MHCFKSLALVSALAAGLAAAAPAELDRRACVTEYPAFISHIYESSPNQPGNIGDYYESAFVPASQGGPYRRDVIVQFENIPAGSYGCQLEAYFPAGGRVYQSGNSLTNVSLVDRPASRSDSWNTAPRPVSLFGTLTFTPSATEPVVQVINTSVCNSTLTYRFSIAAFNQEAGNVYFQIANGVQGLRIRRNC
jgi:hypothetical protein